jgi:hypothetical protein
LAVCSSSYLLTVDYHRLSIFVEESSVGQLLATRGGSVDVKALAAILNREEPTAEAIASACAHLYNHGDISDGRSSVDDEDWIGRDMNKPLAIDSVGEATAAQRIREWRPQMAINSQSITQIGFTTTSVSEFTGGLGHTGGLGPVGGLSRLESLNQGQPMEGFTTMGFMSSRTVLPSFPPEPHPNTMNPKKRKLDNATSTTSKSKDRRPIQTTLNTWVNQPVHLPKKEPQIKVRSSGIVQDRGKPVRTAAVVTFPQQMSSPERGYDIEALPAVSFSSPIPEVNMEDLPTSPTGLRFEEKALDDLPASPIAPTLSLGKRPTVTLGPSVGHLSIGSGSIKTEKRSLGMRGAMKPWPSRR